MNRIQAMELDGQIRKHLEEYSLQNGLNPAFGNTIMDKYLQIIPDTAKREMIFLGDKSVSYKLGNIRLDIKSGLVAVAGITFQAGECVSICPINDYICSLYSGNFRKGIGL